MGRPISQTHSPDKHVPMINLGLYLDWIIDIRDCKSLSTSAGLNNETDFAITCKQKHKSAINKTKPNQY